MPAEADFGYRGYDVEPGAWDGSLNAAAVRWFQHLVVFELRREMAGGATSRTDVAQLLDVTVGHMGKKLAGTAAVTAEDVVRLAIAFGPSVVPRFDRPAELFPPGFRELLLWDRDRGMARPSL